MQYGMEIVPKQYGMGTVINTVWNEDTINAVWNGDRMTTHSSARCDIENVTGDTGGSKRVCMAEGSPRYWQRS